MNLANLNKFNLKLLNNKNAMNWASYQGLSFDDTRAYLYVAGTSYPITNNTIGGRLSLGSYTEGYTETAAGLFKAGEVKYTVAPGDNVGTGIGLPWVSGALGLGIGNTSATGGRDGFRIPILGMLSGDHTEAYYRDRESIEFLYSNKNKPEYQNIVEKIINRQKETWGKVGPVTDTIKFENNKIVGGEK